MKTQLIEEAYRIARERYAAVGVDTDEALEKLQRVSLSLHCWQADDVTGFENRGGELTGGIQTTGNYPGKARNVEELAYADLLLHVVDVSDEDWQVQAETVDKVIAQLGAQDIPRLMVYNKADKCDPDVIPFIRPDEGVKISAKSGELVLISINMRDGSVLARGKGNPDWNYSAPHGAGRIMSRTKAKETLDIEQYKKSMEGIYTTSVNNSTLDEAPMAYKSLSDIIDVIRESVDVIEVLKPIYNFKACE